MAGKVKPAKPTSIIAQVEDSGTAIGGETKNWLYPTACPISWMLAASFLVEPDRPPRLTMLPSTPPLHSVAKRSPLGKA
jgi:hypothetical protein